MNKKGWHTMCSTSMHENGHGEARRCARCVVYGKGMLGIRGKMVGLGPPSCGRRIESRHGLYQRRYQCLEPGLLQRATGIRPRSNLPPARRLGCGPHTWLPGMGSVALRRYQYLAHSQNWPAAGATEFRWTAV